MKLKSLKKNNKGFTLVELIVVLAIIAIMLAVTVPSFLGYVNQTKTEMDALTARNQTMQTELDKIQALNPDVVAPAAP